MMRYPSVLGFGLQAIPSALLLFVFACLCGGLLALGMSPSRQSAMLESVALPQQPIEAPKVDLNWITTTPMDVSTITAKPMDDSQILLKEPESVTPSFRTQMFDK